MRVAVIITAIIVWPLAGATQSFSDLTQVSGTLNAGLYSTGIAWADYNGDDNMDLYVTNWGTGSGASPANKLYRNEGDGTFTDVAAIVGEDLRLAEYNSIAPAWGDYDGDGTVDLFVGSYDDQGFLFRNQAGTFVETGRGVAGIDRESRGNVTTAAWGDYDNDGNLDLYLGKWYFKNELYRNSGDGTFATVTDLGLGDKRDAEGLTWVDYDNDGDQDLYVVNREQENALYRNDLNSDSGFTEVACALTIGNKEIGQDGAWADYDNDGDVDLFLANVGGNALYRNDGEDSFLDVAEAAEVRNSGASWISASAAWADAEGDGDWDLYLATGGDRQAQSDVFFVNKGDGTFSIGTVEAGLSVAATAHTSVAWADFSGEGAPDLYLTDGYGPYGRGSQLFQNETSGANFIRVKLMGKGSASGGANTGAIGAQVRFEDGVTGELISYQQVMSGNNELIFGAPAGPYNIKVLFPGNPVAVTYSEVSVSGGGLLVVPEL